MLLLMIKTFKHRGLKELFESGATRRLDPKYHARCLIVLNAMNGASHTNQLALPGWNTHPLKQYKPWRWSIWISGATRITFEFDGGHAYRVDFEQYH